jgi:hypothetical protein
VKNCTAASFFIGPGMEPIPWKISRKACCRPEVSRLAFSNAPRSSGGYSGVVRIVYRTARTKTKAPIVNATCTVGGMALSTVDSPLTPKPRVRM